jgi:hypothetical protein
MYGVVSWEEFCYFWGCVISIIIYVDTEVLLQGGVLALSAYESIMKNVYFKKISKSP